MKSDLREFSSAGRAGLMLTILLGLVGCSSDDGAIPGTGGTTPPEAPVAVDDGPYQVIPGSTLQVSAASGVLANDAVPGELASISVVQQPSFAAAAVTISLDGRFNYRHQNSGAASRTDSFVYQLADTEGQTSQATVQIVANTPPVALNDFYEAPLDAGCLNVLNNDRDDEGDALTITEVFNAIGFIPRVDTTSNTICVDSDVASNAQFDYTVVDDFGGEATATVFIGDFQGGGAPQDVVFAKNDVFTVARGGSLTVTQPGVILNDSIDGDNATQFTGVNVVLNVAPSQHDDQSPVGGFELLPNGRFSYVHDGSDQVVDTFSYTLVYDDGNSVRRSGSATVSIQILESSENEAPKARNEIVRVNPSQIVDVPVLYNDSDREDGVPSYLAITSDPACGSVDDSQMPTAGFIRYTHDANLAGCVVPPNTEQTDSFSYQIADSNAATDQATVTVRISNAQNTQPVAADDEVSTPADQTILINVLRNDADADGDIVILTSTDQPNIGSVTLLPRTGQVSYQAESTDLVAPPYSDVFEYQISDGRGGVSDASVTVNVRGASENQAPIACDDPMDVNASDDPPSGCVSFSNGSNDAQGNAINLFTVPACMRHELALNVLLNDTDSDPEDRPAYRFQAPSVNDPNPPRHVLHAPADLEFGVGALRITDAPTVTNNDDLRSLVRVSDDRRFIYFQHVGSQDTLCDPAQITGGEVTFNYVVTDDKGESDEGLVRVAVVPGRAGGAALDTVYDDCNNDGVLDANDSADCDGDLVPNTEDQCLGTNLPQEGQQTSTPSNTVFSNGCTIIPTGQSLTASPTPVPKAAGAKAQPFKPLIPSVDPDLDSFRGTDDQCPEESADAEETDNGCRPTPSATPTPTPTPEPNNCPINPLDCI